MVFSRFSNNRVSPLLAFCAGLMVFTGGLLAQPAGQEVKWIRIGELHSWYSNLGAELELGRTGQAEQQQDGLRFPAGYKLQDNMAGKSMWIGTTNYDDPVYGITFAAKVVSVGTRSADAINEIMPYDFKMYGRYDHPLVFVDGDPGTDNEFDDIVDEVDPTLPYDRKIVSRMHSSIGISIDRTIMAYGQEKNDNYHIIEYVFKNTGIINLNGDVVEKTLTGVVFHFQARYAFGHEAFIEGWAPSNNINWGRNAVHETVWADPFTGEDMRAQYAWYGPHTQSSVGCAGDLGLPNVLNGGPLGAPQYVGTVVLHADVSASDKSHDVLQPTTTKFLGSDTENEAINQYHTIGMQKRYGYMTAGHPEFTQAQQIGSDCGDAFGGDAGGYAQGMGFGQYTLAPGDSIRIVIAEAVGSINRLKSEEVGDNWYLETGDYVLPDGSSSTDRFAYKDAWIRTGIDSLFLAFRNAREAFANDYVIQQPPQPPNSFEVVSGGDQIKLTWNNNAEGFDGFDGYLVYRAIGKPDTSYEQIMDVGLSDLTNEYSDTEARRGFDYFYYLQSKFLNSSTGERLNSSRFYTITNLPANLKRPAEIDNLAAIRVVPNPYDIRSRSLQFSNNAPDRLAFFGLPPRCTIKIYTERGDLITTIDHTDGSGDELWHSMTDYNQIVVSGVYIALFETPEGESAFRKFIIIR